ncbi:hypothetical protein A2634_04140 [Candidatus Amesbacteria bacterium RIFCSPHIGHO2_01_FULL_48_32]|uniref:VOC domain-containing protein n=1 Tax=Candidatus Amesbacteria bacterium RIFCSPLOWO2_01_FULL_48_25 TaxID=1797259 RepID=A0A1F4ZDZ4_9BACT|nr:MAG: hypothetical protein A2634_04140 [Candidatus Amesbacteria bacterium RIFCSPHIGHO2_01_FULL_48_32]OGD03907.1 MAG: hypothetical protein A2989_04370 [Candidatus Amesbacteria bacterium RIFCSPLOWO2_01_FULL_48_25]HJZ05868.1 VOC family protein [Patescibacteria group bacterium]
MIKTLEGILLSSPSAKKLAKFYQNTLGLKLKSEAVFGEHDEEFYEFDLGKTSLYIADHSEVRGTNPNPQRIILNFEVDNIEREITRLKKAKVKLVAKMYHIQDYGYIATFADLDGNYFQLVKTRG